MKSGKLGVLVAAVVCVAIIAAGSDALFGQNKELTAAELVAKHLNAIGKPDVLAKAKSRGLTGDAAVQFVQGAGGELLDGQFLCASEGQNIGMQMKFKDNNYPGEYFAFNGKETTVGHISPGVKSPIADFIFRYNAIMKEGLLGGVLSMAWPLLNSQEKQVELEYRQEKVDERNLHVLAYGSRKNLGNDLKVKLFFDPEFRHIRTEYRVRIKNDIAALPSVNSGQQAQSASGLSSGSTNRSRPEDRQAASTIQGSQADNIYVMVEKFGNFANIGGLILPQDYSIDYQQEGQLAAFVARWAIMIEHWIPNRPVDPSFFVAQK